MLVPSSFYSSRHSPFAQHQDTGKANIVLKLLQKQKKKTKSSKRKIGNKDRTTKIQKEVDELGIEPRTFRMLGNMLSERSTN